GAVQGGADVVAHAAVDADVGPCRTAVESDVLDRADPVEGQPGRTDHRAARLDGDLGWCGAEVGAPVPDNGREPLGDLARCGRHGAGSGVAEAVAAAEVDLGHQPTGGAGDVGT